MGTQAKVIRIVEYEGDAGKVFAQVERSLRGSKNWGNGVTITAETLKTEVYDCVPERAPTETELLLDKIRNERMSGYRFLGEEVLW